MLHEQTDFDNPIHDWGCLEMCGIKLVCDVGGIYVNHKTILMLHVDLNLLNLMTDYPDKSKNGCYFWDHEKVLNQMSIFLKVPYRWKYKAAVYLMKDEAARSWGSYDKTDHLIIQVQTVNGNGHFRMIDYDPYAPSPEIAYLRSLRYYEAIRI